MKTYTSKPNDTLGSIARKFGMPSWKYLYQLNKDKIGDNPDLLKEGTVLKIPQWDSTGGDEKLRAKGVDPSDWTGGLRYKFPSVPVSLSLVDRDGNLLADFEGEREFVIWDRKTKRILHKGMIQKSDTIEKLVPDSKNLSVGIKGFPIVWEGDIHYHPDDVPAESNAIHSTDDGEHDDSDSEAHSDIDG